MTEPQLGNILTYITGLAVFIGCAVKYKPKREEFVDSESVILALVLQGRKSGK